MIIFKKSIPRRTFLRGLGASVALPMLDAMIPALARPGDVKMPLRVGYIYTANGIIRERFQPATAGSNYEMTDILKPWEPYRDQLLVLSNLNNGNDKVNGHVGGCTTYLTGVAPNKSLSDARAGISVDQVIARKFAEETPLGSLQLCIENAAERAGQAEDGYSAAYTNTVCWGGPTTPLPMEARPREVFERLFGDAGTDPAARQARIHDQKSILDFVKEEAKRYKKKLGAADSAKLSEFTDTLRDVELGLQKAEEKVDMELPDMKRPMGIPEHEDHIRLMYDLMLLAFQTDMTRVGVFMLAREFSEQVYTQLGHQDPYHPLTHHRGDPVRKRQAGEIDMYHAKLFGEFLAKMKATKEADGSSLLDNSILVYGAGMGDGDIHSKWNVPIAVLGGGRGTLKGGRHIVYKEGTLLTDLHVAILNKAGIPTESFGEDSGRSNGELDLSRPA